MRFPAVPGIAIGVLVACGRLAFEPVEDPDSALQGCPQGAGYVAAPEVGREYRALGRIDYHVAKTICAADRTRLATVDDALEATVLVELATPGSAWAGVENVDGEWRRQDGELATYLPWEINEPTLDVPGAVVELYPTLRFRSTEFGTYQWFAFCECVP